MNNVLIGISLFVLAQTISWFQSNALLVSDWFRENTVAVCVIFGPIIGPSFAYGTKFLYAGLGELWAVRFLAFSCGYLIFIPLTWHYFGESPFTLKNVISTVLCFALIAIQIFMKN